MEAARRLALPGAGDPQVTEVGMLPSVLTSISPAGTKDPRWQECWFLHSLQEVPNIYLSMVEWEKRISSLAGVRGTDM